jgi:hypothetical protein
VQHLFAKRQPTQGELIAQEVALDEREIKRRDRIHFSAYTIVQVLVLIFFFFNSALLLWKQQELLLKTDPLLFFLLTLTVWSLPQSILLWTEPDQETEQ